MNSCCRLLTNRITQTKQLVCSLCSFITQNRNAVAYKLANNGFSRLNVAFLTCTVMMWISSLKISRVGLEVPPYFHKKIGIGCFAGCSCCILLLVWLLAGCAGGGWWCIRLIITTYMSSNTRIGNPKWNQIINWFPYSNDINIWRILTEYSIITWWEKLDEQDNLLNVLLDKENLNPQQLNCSKHHYCRLFQAPLLAKQHMRREG